MLDGAVTPERIEKWSTLGVKGYILGTATLFRKDRTYKEAIKKFKELKYEKV